MRNFPNWFWISIIIYMITSWLFVAVTSVFSELIIVNFEWFVGYGLFYIGILAYPVFFAVMMICLYQKTKLNSDEKVWSFLFLLVPLVANLPLLAHF
ncbi:hypothetical protein EU245_09945 [Lentibacillus lipolyticus]|nr:hypothetical protein EU245_09945 [Lentibacillus lipolyticus]